MKYHSQYRSHDLFELQHSLSGLNKIQQLSYTGLTFLYV